MANQLNTATKFANGYHRKEDGRLIRSDTLEEVPYAGVSPCSLAAFANDVGINQVHCVRAYRPCEQSPDRVRHSAWRRALGRTSYAGCEPGLIPGSPDVPLPRCGHAARR